MTLNGISMELMRLPQPTARITSVPIVQKEKSLQMKLITSKIAITLHMDFPAEEMLYR